MRRCAPAAAATRRWRTPEDARHAGRDTAGLIGPNAILQLLPVLERELGAAEAAALIRRAGIAALPDGHAMIPEGEAAALHRRLRAEHPARAPRLAAEAGARTADYLLAHRIPSPVRGILRHLPPAASAAILSRAIARNAWTFAGSGTFRREGAWRFAIAANPLVAGEFSRSPLCQWHAAVFGRLYRELVAPDCLCTETRCTAQGRGAPCEFVITRA